MKFRKMFENMKIDNVTYTIVIIKYNKCCYTVDTIDEVRKEAYKKKPSDSGKANSIKKFLIKNNEFSENTSFTAVIINNRASA